MQGGIFRGWWISSSASSHVISDQGSGISTKKNEDREIDAQIHIFRGFETDSPFPTLSVKEREK